jgi:hypothetical protein
MSNGSTKQSWALGGMIFAATMMMVMGIFEIFQGIAAIARDQFFVVTPNYYYNVDTTTWGWIHLGIGVLAVVAGFFLFSGATWARVVGIIMAAVSATANFFFLPYYPIWSLVIIAINIFVIWAIASAPRLDRGASVDTMAMGGAYAGDVPQDSERWPTNQPGGRHWKAEPAKEGTRTAEQQQAAQQQAAAQQGRGGTPMPPPDMPG